MENNKKYFNFKIKVTIYIVMFLLAIFIIIFIDGKTSSNLYDDSNLYPDSETLTLNLSDEPQIPWNIIDVSTYVVETFSTAVHGSLISSNGTFKESTDNSVLFENYFCDGNVCYASLKKGILFHNKREVTAYDVEFSFIRQLLNFSNDNFANTILDDVIGIEHLKAENIKNVIIDSFKYPSGLIEGIQVKDKYNIIFHLKRENSHFFQKISTGFVPIVPIEELDHSYLKWKKLPIGFGKYKVVKADSIKHNYVIEKVNKNDDIPKYIRFIFDERNIGDIKGTIGLSKTNENYDSHMIFPDIYANAGFLFNYKTELGANQNFRQAISLALDRKKIAKISPFGEFVPDDQMLPESGWQKNYRAEISIQSRNLKKAKELMETIPKNLWKDRVFHVHTFWTSKKDLNRELYIIEIKQQLQEIGIHIFFHNTDMSYTKFKVNDKNVLWWTSFDTATKDPNTNFAYFRKGSFFNNIYQYDPQYEKLYEEATKNLSKSPIFSRNLSQYFTENNMMVIVFQLRKSFLYRKKRISTFGNQYSPIKLLVWEIKLHN
jgi:ABC-type transport system substrate-binding protein